MDNEVTGKNACPTEAGEFAHLAAGLAGRCGAESIEAATGDRVAGIDLQRAGELVASFGSSTLSGKCDAEVGVGVSVIGVELQRFGEGGDCLIELIGAGEGDAEIVSDRRVAGIGGSGSAIFPDRFL